LGGASGGYIKAALDRLGLPNEMILSNEQTRTNIKIVDPVLKTSTDINESGAPVSRETLLAVWEKLMALVKPGDTVVFAGKNPPGMADELLAAWIRRLKSLDIRVCVDTVGNPMRLALEEKPDIIKPNKSELSEIMGTTLVTDAQVLDAAKELVRKGVGLAAVSMGDNGAFFVTKNEILRGYCPKVSVVSTVGAGDSMMAALAHYTAAGCSLEETARRAIAVSSACVMCDGSQPAELDKILPLIDRVRIERLRYE
jgi:1-phosphofructokinase